MSRISSQMKLVLEQSVALMPTYSITETQLAEVRKKYAQERLFWNSGGPEIYSTVETKVKGPVGPIPVRMYNPDPIQCLPVLVYLHGGGFVVGNNDSHDRMMRELAERAGCAVLGVEYSLSPEQKFPVALEETLSVLEWLKNGEYDKKSPAFNIDRERIILGGDSAGASLSMGAALSYKENLSGLLLIYGWYGLKISSSSSLPGGAEDGLSEEDMTFYMNSYLHSEDDLNDVRLNVLSADLQGFPPCCLIAAELDPLLDDSTTLATLLEKADVSCELHLYESVIHGFLHYSRMLDAAVSALDQAAIFLRKIFKTDA
ncbi:MAG: alpha/beta hydrolase fold domain-containing protein [SAR324 cluster bacterium]|nr:alpha/beta hydrolase fold domain-containing protein [SAR324 cluster bacterium]MBL7034553.1 alpha/beta hydrolase fold domain-containing protein [SAR324 cluster bacterium]